MRLHKGRRRLTKKNTEALAVIVQYKQNNDGNSPSYMELKELLGYKTTSAVDFRIKSMVRDGLIEIHGHRQIAVSGGYQNWENKDQ